MKKILKFILIVDILLAVCVMLFDNGILFPKKNENPASSSEYISEANTEPVTDETTNETKAFETSENVETESESSTEDKEKGFFSKLLDFFCGNKKENKDETEGTHTYEVLTADISWSAADKLANASGGHLLTLSDEDEFTQVISLIEKTNPELRYVWIGGCQDSNGNYAWVTGEDFSYAPWYSNGSKKEPSYKDVDGTIEDCLCMWCVKGVWSINDQRNDLLSAGSFVEGKIGYVIEYEN